LLKFDHILEERKKERKKEDQWEVLFALSVPKLTTLEAWMTLKVHYAYALCFKTLAPWCCYLLF